MKKLFCNALTTFFLIGLLFPLSLSAQKSLNGAGASFPYPVYQTWAYKYYKENKIKINYQSIGSGGGIRQVTSRTVDFGASDAPLEPEAVEENKLLQFPAIIGGVVPAINIEGIEKGELKLSGELLASIFLGDIKKWNDKRIASLNKGIKLPDAEITVVHRADGSGTTAIFSSYLSAVSDKWRKEVGSGKALNWKTGIGGKGNEGVANYIKRLDNSIGYVEYAYVTQNNLNYIRLKNKSGNFVEPSFESFKEAASKVSWDINKHFYNYIIDVEGENSWPIVGASFILLPREKKDMNKNVVKFYDWAFKNGDKLAMQLDYVPLPDNLKEMIRKYWKKYDLID
ncbi:MAG: phosphate ABC transporter substrate-binding protein PstS [Deferribacterota bacterium]|nr:phosphate ABC transporter substrate-binding protein PstS [Deferribacterota bacterium]